MSGIYIPGMEMPTSCWCCACHHHKVDEGYYDYDVCRASGTVFNDGYSSVTGNEVHIDPFKQRLDNCPLVPVPKHGDLIDRDKLEKDIDKYIGGEESRSRFHHWVQVQYAVIPMDKGEEK